MYPIRKIPFQSVSSQFFRAGEKAPTLPKDKKNDVAHKTRPYKVKVPLLEYLLTLKQHATNVDTRQLPGFEYIRSGLTIEEIRSFNTGKLKLPSLEEMLPEPGKNSSDNDDFESL